LVSRRDSALEATKERDVAIVQGIEDSLEKRQKRSQEEKSAFAKAFGARKQKKRGEMVKKVSQYIERKWDAAAVEASVPERFAALCPSFLLNKKKSQRRKIRSYKGWERQKSLEGKCGGRHKATPHTYAMGILAILPSVRYFSTTKLYP
jgi:hypothetical protein